jgi:hypothetical protein
MSSKIYFSIYGNCQLKGITQFLLTNTDFSNKYEYIENKLVHMMNTSDLDHFYKILPILGLLFIQPINDNYKENFKFSTTSVLKHISPNCIIILLPSLYFNGYFPFTGHLSYKSDFILKPMPLHDKNLLNIYIKNNKNREKTESEYKELLYNKKLINKNVFEKEISESINKLQTRESHMKQKYNILNTLSYSDFILKNYTKFLICYSDSHPTKYTFRYFSNQILSILKISQQQYPDELDPERGGHMPLYTSLNNILDFEVSKDIIINNYQVTIDMFINNYLDIYDTYDIEQLKKYY